MEVDVNIFARFFDHIATAITLGDWCCGFEKWDGKPMLMCGVMPYDGWNFALHVWRFYVCVSYPWCGGKP